MKKKTIKKWTTLVLVIFLHLSFNIYAQENKNVLLISSYNSRFPTYFQQINAIKSVLDTAHFNLDVEFMDSKRFTGPTTYNLFYKSLKNKLENGAKYDALLTADDDAFNFVLQNEDELFKNIPIVFFGVNNIKKAIKQNANPNVTGVVESVSMKETIELMIRLFPETGSVYCISDSTSSGLSDLELYRQFSTQIPKTEFKEIILSQHTFSEYKVKLKRIPSNAPVLLLSSYVDKMQFTIDFDNTMNLHNENLQAPLFHLWEHGIGDGILGGKLISHFEQGKKAAKIVYNVLSGEPIIDIKVINKSPNVFMFDYSQLTKYNVPIDKLPNNSIIINQPVSFWNKYKQAILITVLILLALLILIAILFGNIIKRKKTEEQLKIQNLDILKLNRDLLKAKVKAEENDQLKSAFLANMSHEIRTPMNGILGFTGLLKEPKLSGEQQKKYIQIIEKSGDRMLNIINEIMNISKIESGIVDINLTEVNINNQLQFIYDSLKLDADHKKLHLTFTCPLTKKEAIIKTDNEKLYGILTNLVKNAIKYTDKGTIEFGCTKKENEIKFFVKDSGIGIPKKRLNAIFERFIQADIVDKMARQGVGLGLTISKAYVKMLGGKIWVESVEAKGSTFFFTIPSNINSKKENNTLRRSELKNQVNTS